MTGTSSRRPVTDPELYDYVQRLFGIGEWDAILAGADNPWWRARTHEVVKIRARRMKLKVSVEELANAADYCKAHGIVIHNVAWLYKHIADGKREASIRRREEKVRELEDLIDAAIACERALPSSDWLDRLVRARGPYRREAYDQWKSQRGTPVASPSWPTGAGSSRGGPTRTATATSSSTDATSSHTA